MQLEEDHSELGPEADAHFVRYTVTFAGIADEFAVRGFEATEALNEPYRLIIRIEAVHEAIDSRELLGRDALLVIERADQRRVFHGIVGRIQIDEHGLTGQYATIEVLPALYALRFAEDTRIFQEKTAIDIVEEVLSAGLRKYDRAFDTSDIDRGRYLTRDYCVQYREATLDFVHRLLEEEGVGYYFRHDEQRETLVLFDDNADLVRARTMDQGPVRFDSAVRAWTGAEPVLRFGVALQLGSTAITVRDHDWTSARPTIEVAQTDTQSFAPRHAQEIYEHGLDQKLTIHEDNAVLAAAVQLLVRGALPFGMPPGLEHRMLDLPGAVLDSFTSSDAAHQLTTRQQRIRRDARVSRGVGVVTGFSPGRTFTLAGHPTLGADGEYVITKVVHSSTPSHLQLDVDSALLDANYENVFECLPLSTAWRPDRKTRKPRIHGVQTARVTGPIGMDVHTDQHGRIKVRFPWDRAPDDVSGHYTCWLRVSQTWAGQGAPGFVFIPRVGMEVVVSFVDGDPDRPLVTGCVYNGANPTPSLLPIQATKSVIRTRTIPHGEGYNELSFEDAMGIERVHLRAQRDLEELVLNNHETTVCGNQRIQIGEDQNEAIMRDQHLTVNGTRVVRVGGTDSVASMRDHRQHVGGNNSIHVRGNQSTVVEGGSAVLEVQRGEVVVTARTAISLVQGRERSIEISGQTEGPGIAIDSEGATIHVSKDVIELKVGRSTIRISDNMIQVNNKTFPAS
jgi:type VI secretion system secreted protein VgrG